MIYVASPYSHPDMEMMEARFQRVSMYVRDLLADKQWCYSPIVHCHELALTYSLPTDASYWGAYNRHMISKANSLHVLMLKDWEHSHGIKLEIVHSHVHGAVGFHEYSILELPSYLPSGTRMRSIGTPRVHYRYSTPASLL